jgi:hypothetical protein
MASVEKRERAGKVTWLARWRDDAGRQRKRSFARRIDAQRFIAQIEADMLRGQYVDPSDRTTVQDYARKWADSRIHRQTTARRVSGMIETHIAGTTLGARRLAAVTPSEVLAEFPPGEDGTLFTTRFGTPYRHDYYGTRIFKEAVAKAGLPEGTTSHDLRHHYASVLLAHGESVVAVAERLGHHNAGLVLSTYGHLMPDSEDRTRRAVDNAWSGSAPPVPHEGDAGR